MELTYSQYLELHKILDAQHPLSPEEHDETLFIVIHQTYELWFKQLLHESNFLRTHLQTGKEGHALETLRRMLVILKTLVSQADILETMTPISFYSFRNRLQKASGFQSLQFRRLEFQLGLKSARILELFSTHDQFSLLSKDYEAPTLYDALLEFLSLHRNIQLPIDILQRHFSTPYTGDIRVQHVLLELYRERSDRVALLERYVDLDEGLQEWRYRHVKMVERTIGCATGTGGSAGAAYLRSTLFQPAFVDLWALRSFF
jgi:tryptophan 2,3-dioxygenase